MSSAAAPAGWHEAKLEEVAEVAIGGTPARKEKAFWEPTKLTGNRWASIADLKSKFIGDTSEYISDLGVQRSNVKLVPEGTLLMSFKLSLGRVAITAQPIYTNEAIAAFYPNDKAETEFLYYLLPTLALEGSSDVAVKGKTLNKAKLRALRLTLPTLPEQRKIAAILSSVDDAIEKTQAVIGQVQVVKRGLMQDLLTRGLPGRHTRVKQTAIGEMPDCWRLSVLGEVLEDIEAGWSPKCEGRPAEEGEWGVLKVSSVSGGRFKQHENKALSEGLEPRPEIEVADGDVLLARASGALDLVGRSVFVHGSRPRLMLSDKTLRLRVRKTVIRPVFLNLLLNEDGIRQQVLMRTTGSHMRNVSQRALRRVPVPLPSLEEQEEIEMLEVQTSTRLREERSCLEQLGMMKSALMSVLLTGELRVTPDTEAA